LQRQLGKPTGPGVWAESWEIVDHRSAQSVVASGPLKGRSLHELVERFQAELVGAEVWKHIQDPSRPETLRGRFPLLVKFLDAEQLLSVQVHPNDVQAARLNPPDLGKTEAWVVLDTHPGAVIYAGLKQDVDEKRFAEAIRSGTVESCLHSFEPHTGDCVFVPAGTQHAIGAGLLILEIQQASDTTFRVYDWNRTGPDGRPRELHIDQAMRVTNFQAPPVAPQAPVNISGHGQKLVSCPYFEIRRWHAPIRPQLGKPATFVIVAVTAGHVRIENVWYEPGQTVLLPPSNDGYAHEFEDGAELLEVFVPVGSED
jgi:mannose-6-phosphate isomerase